MNHNCKSWCGLIWNGLFTNWICLICFWSSAAWPPASCTWAFPPCILVLYGKLIPSSGPNWINPPSLLSLPSNVFEISPAELKRGFTVLWQYICKLTIFKFLLFNVSENVGYIILYFYIECFLIFCIEFFVLLGLVLLSVVTLFMSSDRMSVISSRATKPRELRLPCLYLRYVIVLHIFAITILAVFVLEASPASLTESCSFWYGLKDLFTLHKSGTS